MYCINEQRPLKGTNCSSTVIFSDGVKCRGAVEYNDGETIEWGKVGRICLDVLDRQNEKAVEDF